MLGLSLDEVYGKCEAGDCSVYRDCLLWDC